MKKIFMMVLLLLTLLLINGCAGTQAAQITTQTSQASQVSQGPQTPQTQQKPPAVSGNAAGGQNIAQGDKSLREFTIEELAQYNGTDGKPAYIAVKGVVYDVTNSKLWKLGQHIPMGQQLVAGKDLTSLLDKAPPNHRTPEYWAKIPQVGALQSTQ